MMSPYKFRDLSCLSMCSPIISFDSKFRTFRSLIFISGSVRASIFKQSIFPSVDLHSYTYLFQKFRNPAKYHVPQRTAVYTGSSKWRNPLIRVIKWYLIAMMGLFWSVMTVQCVWRIISLIFPIQFALSVCKNEPIIHFLTDSKLLQIYIVQTFLYLADVCKRPNVSHFGRLIEDKTDYIIGELVIYSCIDGYVMIGSQSAVCQENGKFLPNEVPVCRRKGNPWGSRRISWYVKVKRESNDHFIL